MDSEDENEPEPDSEYEPDSHGEDCDDDMGSALGVF